MGIPAFILIKILFLSLLIFPFACAPCVQNQDGVTLGQLRAGAERGNGAEEREEMELGLDNSVLRPFLYWPHPEQPSLHMGIKS